MTAKINCKSIFYPRVKDQAVFMFKRNVLKNTKNRGRALSNGFAKRFAPQVLKGRKHFFMTLKYVKIHSREKN